MFFPKFFKKRRRFRTFASAKMISIFERFFTNNELFIMILNFSAIVPIFFFIKPAMDFIFFYIIFILIMLSFIKIIVDMDF